MVIATLQVADRLRPSRGGDGDHQEGGQGQRQVRPRSHAPTFRRRSKRCKGLGGGESNRGRPVPAHAHHEALLQHVLSGNWS